MYTSDFEYVVILVVVIGCILLFFFQGGLGLIEEAVNEKSLGKFDIDNIPSTPGPGMVCSYSQNGREIGKETCCATVAETLLEVKKRLKRTSMTDVRVYRNNESQTTSYQRADYCGRGSRESRKVGKVVVYHPTDNLASYNAAIEDGLSVREANLIYESGEVYESKKLKDEPVLSNSTMHNIELKFVACKKKELSRFIDNQVYEVELVESEGIIAVYIDRLLVARVSAANKRKAQKYIKEQSNTLKVIVSNSNGACAINSFLFNGTLEEARTAWRTEIEN